MLIAVTIPPATRRGATRVATLAALVLAAPLAPPRTAHAQQGGGVVAGAVVIEGSQRPLVGAQVTVSGDAARGALTDVNGRFRLQGLTGASVSLTVRMIGYRPSTQSVAVGRTDVRFVMAERAVELNQVVVTGTAGGAQKKALGTSVATVDVAEVVQQASVASVDNLLNGRAPGVVVLPGTGQVGAGSQIRVRGIGSFSLSSNPLIYVDGVRVNNQTGTGIVVQAFSSGVISRLNDFSPEEIENIEVLKGPAAATLYGTEAARGVINIITKKGAQGGTRYNFTAKHGRNWFMDYENRIPYNWSVINGVLDSVNVARTEKARGTPLFRSGGIHDYAGNVSGGTGPFRYFASGQMAQTEGVDYANARRQVSTRTNLSVVPSTKFSLETSAGYIKSHTTQSCEAGCGGSLWGSLYSNPANLAKYCTPGSSRGCGWGRGFNSAPPEAYRTMQYWQDINRFTGSLTAKYDPFAWLSNRVAVGTDYTQEGNMQFRPYLTNDTLVFYAGSTYDGLRYEQHHQAFYNTYEYSGSAKFDVGPRLTSKTSAGIQYYTNQNNYISARGDHFPAPGLETITAAGLKQPADQTRDQNNTLGYYGQQELALSDRLFLTGALRVDNNSSFGSEVKWVTYPKLSASWVASEEPGLKDRLPAFIDNLRFRAAFGASGQQPGLNTALRTLTPVAGPNGQAVLTPNTFGNPDLRPERVLGTEAGFEVGLFQDRFGVDFTYFLDKSKDAILSKSVAPSTGFGASTQFFNAGEIDKSGIELALKAKLVNRSRWGWDAQFNLAANDAKIVRLSGRQGDTTIDNGSYSHRVGYAPYSWFSYRVLSASWDPTTRKAVNPICDNGAGGAMPCYNAAGVVQAPKVYLGRGIPPLEGSLTNTLRVGAFRFYAMTDYAKNYKRLDNNLRIRCQIFYTCREYVVPNKTDPRALVQMQSNGTLRDFVINNASFVKLRELSVSYDVPTRLASRVGAQGLALNLAGRNLHTWTPYTGLDPEMMFVSGSNPGANFGVDQAEYPPPASYVLTFRVTF